MDTDSNKEIEFLFVMRGGASFTVRLQDLTWRYEPDGGWISNVNWQSSRLFMIIPGEIAAIVQVSPTPEGWQPILPRDKKDDLPKR